MQIYEEELEKKERKNLNCTYKAQWKQSGLK